jgi:hypothetical protein
MKKTFGIMVLLLLIIALVVTPVEAGSGKANLKGEIKAVEAGKITLETNKGAIVTVLPPEGFDLTLLTVGEWVIVKGTLQEDGSILAMSIKTIGKGNASGDDDDEEDDESGGERLNNAFCVEGKQDRPHPLATKIAARFGVSEEWVMAHFCNGHSMGAILLAIKTSQIHGGNPDDLLAQKADGKGWGQIWQEAGLIGSEREGKSPPGWLKKFAGGKPDKEK